MSPSNSVIIGIAESCFYVTILAAFAWLYFKALLMLADWHGRPSKALALFAYVAFVAISFAPLLVVERVLAWTTIPATERNGPEILLWLASFIVSFSAMFLVHRTRLQKAGYFRSR